MFSPVPKPLEAALHSPCSRDLLRSLRPWGQSSPDQSNAARSHQIRQREARLPTGLRRLVSLKASSSPRTPGSSGSTGCMGLDGLKVDDG